MTAPGDSPAAIDPAIAKWEAVEAARKHWAKLSGAAKTPLRDDVIAARTSYEQLYDGFLCTVPTTAQGLAFQLIIAGDSKRDLKKVMANARALVAGTATPKRPRYSRPRD